MEEQLTQNYTINWRFTTEEKEEISAKMADLIGQAEDKEIEKKSVAKQYTADLDAYAAEIRKLAGLLRDGFERRDEDCPIEPDYENKMVDILHPQTGELVRRTARINRRSTSKRTRRV
jgi:hypothetical protein